MPLIKKSSKEEKQALYAANSLPTEYYSYAKKGDQVFAKGILLLSETYIENCNCSYVWDLAKDSEIKLPGDILKYSIPVNASRYNCEGNNCKVPTEDGVYPGVGLEIYLQLSSLTSTEEEKEKLVEFANYLSNTIDDKTFGFYGYGLEYTGSHKDNVSIDVIRFLKQNKILTKEAFKKKFPEVTEVQGFDMIFSTVDLWEGIDREKYNENSLDYYVFKMKGASQKYEYTFADLIFRESYDTGDDNMVISVIRKWEDNGDAAPLATSTYYKDYVAKYGTGSAIFAWAEYAAKTAEPVLKAYMIYRFLPQLISEIGYDAIFNKLIKELSEKQIKKFLSAALREVISNVIANEILGEEEYKWGDIAKEALISGVNEVVFPGKKKKYVANALECFANISFDTYKGLFNCKKKGDFNKYLGTAAIQCLTPVIVGEFGDKFINRATGSFLIKNSFNFFFNKVKLGKTATGELLYKMLDLDNVLKDKSLYTKGLYKKALSKESGATAMDILLKAEFNVVALSSANFQRLANIIEKYGTKENEALILLFKQTKDVNRMLVFLDNMVNSTAEYSKKLQTVLDNKMFEKTITINGKKMKFSEFFNSSNPQVVYDYYHMVEGNKHYFAKIENGNGILIVLETVGEYTTSTLSNISKEVLSEEYKRFIKKTNKIKTEDEE